MFRIQTILALMILSTCAFAQPPVLVLTDTESFIMTLENGVPTYVKIEQIIDWRGKGDSPTGPTTPQPPPIEKTKDPELTKKARDVALSVKDPQTAQLMALIYRHINDVLKAGTLNTEQAIEVMRTSTDAVLLVRLRTDHWQTFRDFGSAELTFRRQTPSFDMSVFLVAMAHGLEAAADGSVKLGMAERLEVIDIVNAEIDKVTK